MKRNKRVAVTGGIGSGKSALLNIFRELGYPVVSCDEISNTLWQDKIYKKNIAELFPECMKDGELDKQAVSNLVFSDDEARAKLNAFSHPYIMERVLSVMHGELSFAEVPLLFEGGFENEFDATVVVLRDLQARIQAVQSRNGLSEEEILSRISVQFNYETLDRERYFVVSNDGSLDDLKKQAENIINLLKQ